MTVIISTAFMIDCKTKRFIPSALSEQKPLIVIEKLLCVLYSAALIPFPNAAVGKRDVLTGATLCFHNKYKPC